MKIGRSLRIAVIGSWLVIGCRAERESIVAIDSGPAATASVAPPAPDPLVALADQLGTADKWREAFALCRPRIHDVKNAESDGETLFAVWSSKRLYWTDVAVTTNETSVAKVLKDSEAERGHRACAGGHLVQIRVDRRLEPPLYVGIFQTDAGGLLKFIAVGDTGDLVAGSNSRFCGIVAGAYDYDNSGGGVGHRVAIVGMFDLPENRKRVPPSASPEIAARPSAPVMKAVPVPTDACCSALMHQRAALGASPESQRLDGAISACARNAGAAAIVAALGNEARPASCQSL